MKEFCFGIDDVVIKFVERVKDEIRRGGGGEEL
jgi:hypothetical protein